MAADNPDVASQRQPLSHLLLELVPSISKDDPEVLKAARPIAAGLLETCRSDPRIVMKVGQRYLEATRS